MQIGRMGRPKTPVGHRNDAMLEFVEFQGKVAEFTKLLQQHHREERDLQLAHYRQKRDLLTEMDELLRSSQFSYICADEMHRLLAGVGGEDQ